MRADSQIQHLPRHLLQPRAFHIGPDPEPARERLAPDRGVVTTFPVGRVTIDNRPAASRRAAA
jgi:hypothetical protein